MCVCWGRQEENATAEKKIYTAVRGLTAILAGKRMAQYFTTALLSVILYPGLNRKTTTDILTQSSLSKSTFSKRLVLKAAGSQSTPKSKFIADGTL